MLSFKPPQCFRFILTNIDPGDPGEESAADNRDRIQRRKILDRFRFEVRRYFDSPSPDIGVTGPGCKP